MRERQALGTRRDRVQARGKVGGQALKEPGLVQWNSVTNSTQLASFSGKTATRVAVGEDQRHRGSSSAETRAPNGASQVLTSQERKRPSRPYPGAGPKQASRGRHPYLKGVALHQRDVLLVYQGVLGLQINHISKVTFGVAVRYR